LKRERTCSNQRNGRGPPLAGGGEAKKQKRRCRNLVQKGNAKRLRKKVGDARFSTTSAPEKRSTTKEEEKGKKGRKPKGFLKGAQEKILSPKGGPGGKKREEGSAGKEMIRERKERGIHRVKFRSKRVSPFSQARLK